MPDEAPSTIQILAAAALGGITQALGGVTQVAAGTAAARPPVQPDVSILGIPQKTLLIGLAVLIGVLLFMRK